MNDKSTSCHKLITFHKNWLTINANVKYRQPLDSNVPKNIVSKARFEPIQKFHY